MNFYNTLAEWIDAGKPYHSLVCCDCMDAMKHIEDKQFDLAIVDPPYGIGENPGRALTRGRSSKKWRNAHAVKYSGGNWDIRPNGDYFNELFRVSKNQIIWGGNYFVNYLAPAMGWIAWYKKGQNPNNDFSDCELAYSNFKKATKFIDYAWTGFGAVNAGEKRIHPTQKPRALYRWIILNYAKDCETILDTHAGSCSSCVEFEINGYKWLAFEKDKDYFEDAKARMKRELAQQRIGFD